MRVVQRSVVMAEGNCKGGWSGCGSVEGVQQSDGSCWWLQCCEGWSACGSVGGVLRDVIATVWEMGSCRGTVEACIIVVLARVSSWWRGFY